MQSQAALTLGNSTKSWEKVTGNFSCNTTASPIECLREVPATDLKAYIELESLTFAPVDKDGTQLSDVRPSVDSGKFAKVPIFLGTNENEASVFISAVGNGTSLIYALLTALTGKNDTTLANSLISRALATYYGGGVDNLVPAETSLISKFSTISSLVTNQNTNSLFFSRSDLHMHNQDLV
jgi:carboxylesterase type B